MKPVVRLSGDDDAVRAIGREAVDVLRARPQAASALFARLWSLHQRRRAFVARAAAQPVSPAPGVPRMACSTGYRAVWGVLLGVGLTAALVTAVMFGPSDRKNAFLDPGVAVAVALVAGIVAIPFLLVVLLLRTPDAQSARAAETLAILVGLVCAGLLVFRLVAGVDDGRGLSSADLSWWAPMTAVVVLLLIGIAIRSDVVRRSAASREGRVPAAGSRGDDLRQMRRDAEWAASVQTDAPSKASWVAKLDALGDHVDPAATAQARTMTPAAWLAWMSYDGEIEILGVVPRP